MNIITAENAANNSEKTTVKTVAVKNDEIALDKNLNFIWLEITGSCNLSCTHCYSDSSPSRDVHGNMTLIDWTRVINEASELGCRRLQFIGGEPTVHPHLRNLISHARQKGFEVIEVFTNATRLGDELIGCFQRNKVHVATSFYSNNSKIHESITQGKGSWERTVKGIERVLAAGLPLRVGVIEMEQNIGQTQQAISFLKGLGVSDVGMDRERGVGRGSFVKIEQSGERYEELCGQCWKGRLCVTHTGETFPCVFSRATKLGSAKAGLHSILRSAKLSHFRQRVRKLESNRLEAMDVMNQCYPDLPCGPQTCNPTLPCGPQGPHCSPDTACSPDYRCQPDNQ